MAGLHTVGPLQLQNAGILASGGLGRYLLMQGECNACTVVLQSTGTTSGGTISIEEAYWDPQVTGGGYSGTWSVIQVVNASAFTGGAQLAVQINRNCWAVRARIATDITGGGSISAWAWGR